MEWSSCSVTAPSHLRTQPRRRSWAARAEELHGQLFGIPIVAGATTEVDVHAPGWRSQALRNLGLWRPSGRDNPALLVSLHDVTERKRLEEELRRHAEQLAEADRRKDEFLAMLAHELRNPLAPILNAAHVMRLSGDDPTVLSSDARGDRAPGLPSCPPRR